MACNSVWAKDVFMNKALALSAIIGGAVLIYFGIKASESLASDLSRLFSDLPSDKAIWMTLSGVVLCVCGLLGVSGRSSSNPL